MRSDDPSTSAISGGVYGHVAHELDDMTLDQGLA